MSGAGMSAVIGAGSGIIFQFASEPFFRNFADITGAAADDLDAAGI